MIAAVSEKDFHTIDTAIMPLLTLGFYALQLDRGNIGNALTDFFLRDVGITQNQFNVGQQLLPLGIIILEMPSNLVLYRIGPVLWLGGQMMAWGLIATFLLGLGEAGFIPGSLYTITRWYKRNETSKRFSIFFLGNMLASATSGLIAFGILRMRGIAGLSGWQWLFILEGVFTVVVGVTFLSFFPKSPSKPTSLFAFGWFTERERQIMVARILRDDPSKSQSRPSISWQETKQAASQALSKFYGTSAKYDLAEQLATSAAHWTDYLRTRPVLSFRVVCPLSGDWNGLRQTRVQCLDLDFLLDAIVLDLILGMGRNTHSGALGNLRLGHLLGTEYWQLESGSVSR
ncbi:MFS-type transporter cnsO like protein [Verticillium longisporum]|uniref:MFS-type transporter cnsO like protein n=1 Tax=Verticillium longisporum TaxID=100787 RepID=A0A8I2ZIK0_VERLO|nr:MFS-type transporter cnsO like protein [Verticillium longisporum]